MYYLTKKIESADFPQVVEQVRRELAVQGFGVLTEIDVQATLAEKLGVEMDPYLILGACNPPLANSVITLEPQIGVLLPCNVVVRVDGGAVVIDAMDPGAVLNLVSAPGVADVAADVQRRLAAVIEAVG